MRRFLTTALLMCSSGLAANLEIYSVTGAKFVDPYAFAELVKGQVTIKFEAFFLIAQGKTLKFARGSSTGTLNGKPYVFTRPVTSQPFIYLSDLQKIFKLPAALTYTTINLDPAAPAVSVPATLAPAPKASASPVTPAAPAPAAAVAERLPYDVSIQNSTSAEGLLQYADIDWAFFKDITADVAYNSCISAVSTQLKSPASAQYNDGARVIAYPNKVWGVYGYVDSQNTYGALVRGSYTCIMKRTVDLHSPIFIDITTRK